MKTIIIENEDPMAFRETLERCLNEAMAGQIVMSILYSTREDTSWPDGNQTKTPVYSALIIYRPQPTE